MANAISGALRPARRGPSLEVGAQMATRESNRALPCSLKCTHSLRRRRLCVIAAHTVASDGRAGKSGGKNCPRRLTATERIDFRPMKVWRSIEAPIGRPRPMSNWQQQQQQHRRRILRAIYKSTHAFEQYDANPMATYICTQSHTILTIGATFREFDLWRQCFDTASGAYITRLRNHATISTGELLARRHWRPFHVRLHFERCARRPRLAHFTCPPVIHLHQHAPAMA